MQTEGSQTYMIYLFSEQRNRETAVVIKKEDYSLLGIAEVEYGIQLVSYIYIEIVKI